jgi:nicotinamidase-related amidase
MINNLNKVNADDCAILIIDMQSDFIREGAPIECLGGRTIIPNIKRLKEFASKKNIPVIYTKEIHRAQKIDFGVELERYEPEHCLEGSGGEDIVSDIAPSGDDYVVYKRRYSGFYLTDLEVLLKGLNKNTLILTGAATNVCVYATALDGAQRNYRIVVLNDCTAGINEELHQSFLRNVDWVLGDVTSLNELIQLLK